MPSATSSALKEISMSTRLVRCGIGALASTAAVVSTVLVPGVATADTQAPPAPTNLRIQNVSFTNATLAWNPSADDSGWVMYEIEANALPRSLQRSASTTPSKTITGLMPGVAYTVSVVAVDGSRNRSAPASVQLTTPVDSTPPTTPTILRPVMANGGVSAIAWEASTDSSAVQYVLRSSGNRIFGTRATSVTSMELLYLDCVVAPGSTHTLTVEALDAHNNVSPPSSPVTVTFPSRPL
jgi:fibronectin type III domain protein